jgi:hypothetical protein
MAIEGAAGGSLIMEAGSGRAPRADGIRPSSAGILFLLLTAIASIPVVTHPLPPLSDYINHLARMHIIDAIGSDADLSRYYTIEWQLIPNLMMDLIVPVLHRFMSVYLAGEIFTIIAFVLIISGTLALNRVLTARWSILPLVALPLLYNGVLLVGVMNYVFGVGLALWALAAWIALRERPWPWRYAVSTLFALALFFCHLFAAGVYGLGVLAFELHRLWVRRAERKLALLLDFAASGAPFMLLALLLLAGPTWHVDGVFAYWELAGKFDGLMLAVNVYYPAVTFSLLAVAGLAGIYAWRRGILGFHPVGLVILATGTIVYLAMPRALFGAFLADQRLPMALAFMLIACFDFKPRKRIAHAGLFAVVITLLAVRTTEVQLVWNHLQKFTDQFVQSVKEIRRGSRVLVVYGNRSSGREISDFELVHAASIATIERSAMVSTLFTVRGKQILHARGEFEKYVETEDHWPPSLPYILQVAHGDKANASYFWKDWPQHYDYVYLLFTTPDMRNPDRVHLGLVYGGDAFQLYRVLPTIARGR